MPHVFRYTMEEATKKITDHLVAQRKRSVGDANGGYGCLYKSPDNCMCGVGVLIPEDQYKVELEGRPASHLINLVPAMSNLEPLVLGLVQQYHDHTFTRKGITYAYRDWLRGKQEHHPEKAMNAILEYTASLKA